MRTGRRGGEKSRGRKVVGNHRVTADYMGPCFAVGGHCADCVLPHSDTSLPPLFLARRQSVQQRIVRRTVLWQQLDQPLLPGPSLYSAVRACICEPKICLYPVPDPARANRATSSRPYSSSPHNSTQQRAAPRPRDLCQCWSLPSIVPSSPIKRFLWPFKYRAVTPFVRFSYLPVS